MEFSYSKYIKAHVDIYLCYVNLNSTLANTRLSLAQLCGEKERNLRNSRVYWNPYVRLQYYTSHSFPSSIRLRNYIEPTIRNLSIIHRFKTHLHLSRFPNLHSTGWLQKNPARSSFMIYHRICNMSNRCYQWNRNGIYFRSSLPFLCTGNVALFKCSVQYFVCGPLFVFVLVLSVLLFTTSDYLCSLFRLAFNEFLGVHIRDKWNFRSYPLHLFYLRLSKHQYISPSHTTY